MPYDGWGRVLVLAALALAWGGCNPKNKVQEEDRQGIDVAYQIDRVEDAELDRLEAAIAEDPALKPKLGPVVDRMRIANDDRIEIHRTLLDNFGAPKQPIIYAHETIGDLLTRMRKAHAVGFWAAVGAAILSGGAIALGIARSPLARMIPGFGPVFSALDTTLGGVEAWMQKKKASGEGLQAQDLAEILELAHADKNVGAYIDKKLEKVKLTMGTDPVKLIGQEAVNAAAPDAPVGAPTTAPAPAAVVAPPS